MGAGILPIALYKGAIFLLLGQERKNNKWSDFGGSTIKGEKPFKTAIREGCEELNGFLGDESELEEQVTDNLISSISFDRYTSYIFKISYDKKLPTYFSNVNRFAEIHLKSAIENISRHALSEPLLSLHHSKYELYLWYAIIDILNMYIIII